MVSRSLRHQGDNFGMSSSSAAVVQSFTTNEACDHPRMGLGYGAGITPRQAGTFPKKDMTRNGRLPVTLKCQYLVPSGTRGSRGPLKEPDRHSWSPLGVVSLVRVIPTCNKGLFAYVWILRCRTIPRHGRTGRGRGLDDGWPRRKDLSF